MITPLPRLARLGARTVGVAAAVVASAVGTASAQYATPTPPLDTPPTVDLTVGAVRMAPGTPRTIRVRVMLDEPARLDAVARGITGRTQSRSLARHAGSATLEIPVRRHARLIRAFDAGRSGRIAVQVVATDADGNHGVAARTLRVLPPHGYIPTTQMLSPMPGFAVTSGFGPRWGRTHNGFDIPAPTGTPIHAARDGVVTSVGHDGGYGLTTVVDHGPYETWYAHQSGTSVSVGQHVSRGQAIGSVGTSGSTTGAHLHFEVHVGGAAQDPAQWLG